jgi:hypothetical protein
VGVKLGKKEKVKVNREKVRSKRWYGELPLALFLKRGGD